jgi:hypothetical protein
MGYEDSVDTNAGRKERTSCTVPTEIVTSGPRDADGADLHRLCLETRQQVELLYQLLFFIGERLAADPDDFYRFVQELRAHVQSTIR